MINYFGFRLNCAHAVHEQYSILFLQKRNAVEWLIQRDPLNKISRWFMSWSSQDQTEWVAHTSLVGGSILIYNGTSICLNRNK